MKRKPIIEIGENYKVHIQFFSVFTDVLLDRQASACYLKLAVQHHLRLNFEVKHQFLYFPLDQVGMRLFIGAKEHRLLSKW